METTQILLLVGFIISCWHQIVAVPVGNECVDGQTKLDDEGCNNCFCVNGLWACTLMLCPPPGSLPLEGSTLELYHAKREVPNGNECERGQTQLSADGCNNCFCANGHWACTLRACLHPELNHQSDTKIQYHAKRQAPQCNDGDFKREDCNHCRCVRGYWACSRKLCFKTRRDAVECQQGQTKMEECNSCSCANGRWACTKKHCLKNKRETFF